MRGNPSRQAMRAPVKPGATQERLVARLREFQRQDLHNKRCADCGEIGPTYICMEYGTFICTTCAGLHRELSHRVKGVSLSEWTSEEIDFILSRGNAAVEAVYLKQFNSQKDHPPNGNADVERLRTWIRQKYIDKRWTGDAPPQTATPTASQASSPRRVRDEKPVTSTRRSPTNIALQGKQRQTRAKTGPLTTASSVDLLDLGTDFGKFQENSFKSNADSRMGLPQSTANTKAEARSQTASQPSELDKLSLLVFNQVPPPAKASVSFTTQPATDSNAALQTVSFTTPEPAPLTSFTPERPPSGHLNTSPPRPLTLPYQHNSVAQLSTASQEPTLLGMLAERTAQEVVGPQRYQGDPFASICLDSVPEPFTGGKEPTHAALKATAGSASLGPPPLSPSMTLDNAAEQSTALPVASSMKELSILTNQLATLKEAVVAEPTVGPPCPNGTTSYPQRQQCHGVSNDDFGLFSSDFTSVSTAHQTSLKNSFSHEVPTGGIFTGPTFTTPFPSTVAAKDGVSWADFDAVPPFAEAALPYVDNNATATVNPFSDFTSVNPSFS